MNLKQVEEIFAKRGVSINSKLLSYELVSDSCVREVHPKTLFAWAKELEHNNDIVGFKLEQLDGNRIEFYWDF